ncbi:alpha/beta fold hydrolase [Gordonia sp. HY285]|uniref:alpha/beta fold hydrolase n=1 Tax=Gordonia liuliyuniae TaxID=2911517 RepID=UPI001F465D7D|nr:alpha/beta fold hydrolase [Gordonia liuliyuniae]MCF8611409.1 alpha/beta fold hydrolase [Gordonia liuliyuniae]
MPSIDLPAGPIDYTDTGGDGPVLVFGHGLLMNETQWRAVIPLLTGFRCIAPTWPLGAHRRPMKPDADLSQAGVANVIADFLEALDLDEVTLVLNDWGGGQFIVSEERDHRLGRLVLASCEAFDNFPPKPARPASALCRVPVRRDLAKFATGAPSKTVLRAWHDDVVCFDRPVLLLWAVEDTMMPIGHARRMVGEFPNARLVEVADSWTLLPEDQPERVAAELADFVRTT